MSLPFCTLAAWNGAPTLHVDGKPISSVAYFCTEPNEARIAAMRRAGVNLITWGVGGASAHCNDIIWKGPDRYDYSSLDAAARLILAHHPEAWLMPRVAVTAPNWWLLAHPEHQAVCQAPMYVPSRHSLMLGLYPCACGVRNNGQATVHDSQLANTPLPELLLRQGYRTLGFGKTHSYDERFANHPQASGFEKLWQARAVPGLASTIGIKNGEQRK